jgi:DNA-binding MarR family transcriptional regulator
VASRVTRDNLGYLLAKASQRWNELLYEGFVREGFPEVRPSYGSVLVPLFEEDGLRMGEIAERARLSKQTITTMVRLCERDGLVTRRPDPDDGRAARAQLTPRARAFRPAAERVLAELEAAVADLLGERRAASLRRAVRRLADLEALGERSGDRTEPPTRGGATR